MPCPKAIESESDISKERKRGGGLGACFCLFVLISLCPRNNTPFLQNIICGYFLVCGRGKKRACALIHQRTSYVKTVACFSAMGAVKVRDRRCHGLCQSLMQNQGINVAWIHLKPLPNQGLGHLCWPAACPVPGFTEGDFLRKILFLGCQDFLLYNLVRFLYSPLQSQSRCSFFSCCLIPSPPPVNGKK